MKMRILKITSGMIGCLLAFAVLPARADSITYDLTTGNSAISGYAGNYGSVTVNLTDSTHATITFTANAVSGNQYLFIDSSIVDVNVHATSWTIGSFSGTTTGTGFSGASLTDGGSGNVDGFGSFNQTVNNFDGFDWALGAVSFTLTDTSDTWANAADVLIANANNAVVGAHIAVTTFPAVQSNGALKTGYAAGGPGTGGEPKVPDGGSTIALLGFALLGVDQLRRRISRN